MQLKHPESGPKYTSVSMVIKACLSLSHGNVDVERGFSKSGCLLTDANTAVTEDARLSVCGGMLAYDRKPHLVPVMRPVALYICTPGTCKL